MMTQKPDRFVNSKKSTSLFLIGSILLWCGCSTSEETPVAIGSNPDDLKKSACPCGDIFYRNGILLNEPF